MTPNNPNTQFYTFGVAFRVAVTGEDENFKFGKDVHHNNSYHADDKRSPKGAW